MMGEPSVVGISETMAQAEETVHTLDQEGFPVTSLAIVIQHLVRDQTTEGSSMPGDDVTPRGTATGA